MVSLASLALISSVSYLKNVLKFYLCEYVSVCMWCVHECRVFGGQKRVLDSLELSHRWWCVALCGCRELNQGPLEAHPELITSEAPLQSRRY